MATVNSANKNVGKRNFIGLAKVFFESSLDFVSTKMK
jgi:hypothetical protein